MSPAVKTPRSTASTTRDNLPANSKPTESSWASSGSHDFASSNLPHPQRSRERAGRGAEKHRALDAFPYTVMAALEAAIHLARESRWKLDGRLKCSVRGDSRHLFGDMTDGFWFGQVDG